MVTSRPTRRPPASLPALALLASGLLTSTSATAGADPPPAGGFIPCGVDLVFVYDTSGSMGEELAEVCDDMIEQVIDNLPLGVRVTAYGITTTGGTCAAGTVQADVGNVVPGEPGPCGPFLRHLESWGPATAIVAQDFQWAADSMRVIVPVSDEGPCKGNPCEDPGADRSSITNAITIAAENGVLVYPVTGIGSNQCVITLAEIAAGTGGTAFHIEQGLTYDDVGRLLVEEFETFAGYLIEGFGPGDQLGFSVDGAGDVNGDGYDDFIAGAERFDFGGSDDDRGMAAVLSGFDGQTLYTPFGLSSGDRFGIEVAGAGDLDGDGFDDFIVGAVEAGKGGNGRAYVFSGAAGEPMPYSPLSGPPGVIRFGRSVDGAGDVDGDGYPDLVVGGHKGVGNIAGAAFVFSGLDGTMINSFNGESSDDHFGFSVAGGGDFDGDGLDDIIVGADMNDGAGADAGRAYVYSVLTGQRLARLDGESAGDRFGISVEGVGDVDLDGLDDVIIGAHSADNAAGRAYVYGSGSPPRLLLRLDGEAAGDRFGRSVGAAGDVNRDGRPDVVVGAWGNDDCGPDAGQAYIFSGLDGTLLSRIRTINPGTRFAFAVAGAGDVNADGTPDVVVGAYLHDGFFEDAGAAALHFSTPAELPADLDGDGDVDSGDLALLLAAWGDCPEPPASCPADLDGDGDVDAADLSMLLASWT